MKQLTIIIVLIGILLLAGCKECEQVCVQEERVCERYVDRCIDKNFWGNCVEYERECERYGTQCTEYKDQCQWVIGG